MSNYRRATFPGGYYFFTVVTHRRRPLFDEPLARDGLRQAWQDVRQRRPFAVTAMCLLPDHLHCVWRLPEQDADFSTRWRLIKKAFTQHYLAGGGRELPQSPSRDRKQERGLWQRRFWEHQIRDAVDLHRHIDYIHYNPLKHQLVEAVEQWPWSTYHRYVQQGYYAHRVVQDNDGHFGEDYAGE